MQREEDVVAGTAIVCGAVVLVPLLRVRTYAFSTRAGVAEADVAGFIACGADGTPRVVALGDTPADAAAWSTWLAAHPALLEAIRDRLAATRDPSSLPAATPATD
ncbi:MAG: hypothetical protein FJ148_20040 [Deltaproteobacteria bacterium]|nr:hypothetical protein [Deltaproteobacteria bacterium]